MNLIKFNNLIFTDLGLENGQARLYQSKSILCDELPPDEFVFRAYADKTSDGFNVTEGQYRVTEGDFYTKNPATQNCDLPYGEECLYYDDYGLVGKFYVKSVEYIRGNEYEFDVVTIPYLLMNIEHKGGVYSGTTAGTIIASLMQGFAYTIESDVAAVQMYGFLEYGNCRDNLQQLLFAIGANLFYQNGVPHFKFNKGRTPVAIADQRIYMEGRSFNYKTYATKVNVSEYAYYALGTDTTVTLFDNVGGIAADHLTVKFDKPCHDISGSGLTIHSSGANYAIISGTGTLTGKEYTRTEHVIGMSTGSGGQTREITENKCTLVSARNSANVAARLAAFYSQEREVGSDIVVEGETCGQLYSFKDPQGQTRNGYIVSMNSILSRIRKGTATFAVNWQPDYFGNNFDHYVLLSGSGTWTKPAGVTRIRVVIAQGGQGGQAGGNGETSGYKQRVWHPGSTPEYTYEWTKTAASKGGAKGVGGRPGKVYSLDIDSAAASYSYSVGAAGAGGSVPGNMGAEGGHSTFGSYSSASGAIPENAVVNALTGDVYSRNAYGVRDGIAGGDSAACITASLVQGAGQAVSYGGQTWQGGTAGTYTWNSAGTMYFGGGGGGGAAYGRAGGNGGNGIVNQQAGDAGIGATALQIPFSVGLGGGGQGGCGGGGGGYPGIIGRSGEDGASRPAGVGGTGSAGGNGGAGYIIVYY